MVYVAMHMLGTPYLKELILEIQFCKECLD